MSRQPNLSREELLDRVLPLFADKGFSGVSIRDIASACGQSSASLYNHFADKQTLYLEAMRHAFADRSAEMLEILHTRLSPQQKLRRLVEQMCARLAEDRTFCRLLQREMVDGDSQRLQLAAESIFAELSRELQTLCRQLRPNLDPFLMAGSAIGLMQQHFQMADMRKFLPGFEPHHGRPEVIAEHIVALLLGEKS